MGGHKRGGAALKVGAMMRVLFFLAGGLLAVGASQVSCSKREVGPNGGEEKSFAQQLLDEHNYARTKPKEYAEKFIKPYFGKTKGYAESCYETMVNMAPVGALTLDERFCKAAQWMAEDLGKTGAVSHVGSDGSRFAERLKRYGATNAQSESCSWGRREARAVLLQLLIDEGVESLGHRRNALNAKARVIGVGQKVGGKAAYGVATVIDYGY